MRKYFLLVLLLLSISAYAIAPIVWFIGSAVIHLGGALILDAYMDDAVVSGVSSPPSQSQDIAITIDRRKTIKNEDGSLSVVDDTDPNTQTSEEYAFDQGQRLLLNTDTATQYRIAATGKNETATACTPYGMVNPIATGTRIDYSAYYAKIDVDGYPTGQYYECPTARKYEWDTSDQTILDQCSKGSEYFENDISSCQSRPEGYQPLGENFPPMQTIPNTYPQLDASSPGVYTVSEQEFADMQINQSYMLVHNDDGTVTVREITSFPVVRQDATTDIVESTIEKTFDETGQQITQTNSLTSQGSSYSLSDLSTVLGTPTDSTTSFDDLSDIIREGINNSNAAEGTTTTGQSVGTTTTTGTDTGTGDTGSNVVSVEGGDYSFSQDYLLDPINNGSGLTEHVDQFQNPMNDPSSGNSIMGDGVEPWVPTIGGQSQCPEFTDSVKGISYTFGNGNWCSLYNYIIPYIEWLLYVFTLIVLWQEWLTTQRAASSGVA